MLSFVVNISKIFKTVIHNPRAIYPHDVLSSVLNILSSCEKGCVSITLAEIHDDLKQVIYAQRTNSSRE